MRSHTHTLSLAHTRTRAPTHPHEAAAKAENWRPKRKTMTDCSESPGSSGRKPKKPKQPPPQSPLSKETTSRKFSSALETWSFKLFLQSSSLHLRKMQPKVTCANIRSQEYLLVFLKETWGVSIDSISLWSCKVLLECCLRPARKNKPFIPGVWLQQQQLHGQAQSVPAEREGGWLRKRLPHFGRMWPVVQKCSVWAVTVQESTWHPRITWSSQWHWIPAETEALPAQWGLRCVLYTLSKIPQEQSLKSNCFL